MKKIGGFGYLWGSCKCGESADQMNEEDTIRKCHSCGQKYIKKSYGFCQVTTDEEEKEYERIKRNQP